MRRGLYQLALAAVVELNEFQFEYGYPDSIEDSESLVMGQSWTGKSIRSNLINRLPVIAAEDIGIGALPIIPLLRQALTILRNESNVTAHVQLMTLAQVVLTMAAQPKSRLVSTVRAVMTYGLDYYPSRVEALIPGALERYQRPVPLHHDRLVNPVANQLVSRFIDILRHERGDLRLLAVAIALDLEKVTDKEKITRQGRNIMSPPIYELWNVMLASGNEYVSILYEWYRYENESQLYLILACLILILPPEVMGNQLRPAPTIPSPIIHREPLVVPSWALDKHTKEGRAAGKTSVDFALEGSLIANPHHYQREDLRELYLLMRTSDSSGLVKYPRALDILLSQLSAGSSPPQGPAATPVVAPIPVGDVQSFTRSLVSQSSFVESSLPVQPSSLPPSLFASPVQPPSLFASPAQPHSHPTQSSQASLSSLQLSLEQAFTPQQTLTHRQSLTTTQDVTLTTLGLPPRPGAPLSSPVFTDMPGAGMRAAASTALELLPRPGAPIFVIDTPDNMATAVPQLLSMLKGKDIEGICFVLSQAQVNNIMSPMTPRGQILTASFKKYVYFPRDENCCYKGPYSNENKVRTIYQRVQAFRLLGTAIVDMDFGKDVNGNWWMRMPVIGVREKMTTIMKKGSLEPYEIPIVDRASMETYQLDKYPVEKLAKVLIEEGLYLHYLDTTLLGVGDVSLYNTLYSGGYVFITDYEDNTTRKIFNEPSHVFANPSQKTRTMLASWKVLLPAIKARLTRYERDLPQLTEIAGAVVEERLGLMKMFFDTQ
jgi:hypothetical protein